MKHSELPHHVRDSFHAPDTPAQQLGTAWDYGWRVGDIVFSQVPYPDRAGWSARIRENLQPHGLRIVRPIRSTDGRFVNDGWRANTYVVGVLTKRVDETVVAALRLDEALAKVEVPESFAQVDRNNVFSIADALAWSSDPLAQIDNLDPMVPAHETAIALVPKIVSHVHPISASRQVTHADMFATTIYAGNNAPTVTDIIGVAHPQGYTAAQTIVDGLLFEAVDQQIIHRFEHIPHIRQLLLRSVLYRIFVHALHPEAKSNSGTNLEWVANVIIST